MTNSDSLYYSEINNVAEIIRFHSKHSASEVAIICESTSYTYSELNNKSNQLSNALLRAGLKKQARVAYLGRESEKYYTLLFACAKIGAILVPINWRLVADEVSHILTDSGTEVLFIDVELNNLIDNIENEMTALKTVVYLNQEADLKYPVYDNWISAYSSNDFSINVSSEDSIALMYTSGTTGLPKGVELAHRSFFKIRDSLFENNLNWIDWKKGDRSFIGIPGFHIGGLWWSIQGFSAGITNVTMSVFFAKQALELLQQKKITTACMVPAMINMLLSENGSDQIDFSDMRKIVYGGSPISESLLDQGLKTFKCDFVQIYGLTESGNTAVCLPPQDHKPGSKLMQAAGRPYPCVSLKIIDENGQAVSAGIVGEICIRTPAQMTGYWQQESVTASTLVDGWILTGDAGYVDNDDYLYVCDRIKDTIIVAGENIFPAEVENAILKHSSIVDAAVIGIPDERWGEAVYAFIVVAENSSVSCRDLFLFVKNKIADYKIPTKFEFVDKVPRNPSGKILRRTLRKHFWENKSRNVN